MSVFLQILQENGENLVSKTCKVLLFLASTLTRSLFLARNLARSIILGRTAARHINLISCKNYFFVILPCNLARYCLWRIDTYILLQYCLYQSYKKSYCISNTHSYMPIYTYLRNTNYSLEAVQLITDYLQKITAASITHMH